MLNVERKYIQTVSIDHRKEYGQFYTVSKVASFMVKWLMEKNPSSIYDPAFGMGAFYAAVREWDETVFKASELDILSYEFYKKNSINNNLYLENEDYFSFWNRKYESIVCNPPYLKFQNFKNKERVLLKLYSKYLKKFSGYTNIASAFLAKSIYELQNGGRLAYIMPLEFLNAGYGKVIKDLLINNGEVKIIRINDEMNVFEGVTTTVCIILFEKKDNPQTITFSKIHSVYDMKVEDCYSLSKDDIDPSAKWLSYFDGANVKTEKLTGFVPLSFYGKFKRGIATGANEFFALTPQDVKRLRLTDREVTYCITKSNQIKYSIFDDNCLDKLIRDNDAVYVLNLKTPLSESAKKYVEYGERMNYDVRYLTSKRTPWFSLEKREPSPILFGVFSRGGFKIIRNETKALNLTCYHGFVPSQMYKKYIDILFVYLKSKFAVNCIAEHRRIYGNELTKFEPGDLGKILVPSPEKFDRVPSVFINKIMNYLEQQDVIQDDDEELLRKYWL